MYYRITLILTAFSVLFFIRIASAGMDMKDGLWEITTKMEMPGMPMEMPAIKHTQCLTSKNNVPHNETDKEHNQDCKINHTEIKGNTVTWEAICISEGKPVKSMGTVTYKGNTFKGETKMQMDGMNMIQRMSGQRVGNCK